MSSSSAPVTGAFVGTGADLSVTKVGFKPTYVRLVNIDDPVAMEHMSGMADDTAFKHIDATQSFATSDAITLTDDGFDLGADTDMNVDGETIHYVCWR